MTRKSQHAPSLPYRLGQQFDRAIGVVAPGWAWKRAKLRLVTEAAFKLAKYQGADRGRLFGHWNPGSGSADADLLPDLATLRERSRDLNRNDAIAAGITGTKVANVIGTGIRPQSRVGREQLGIQEGQADALQKAIEQAWQTWVPWADAENRQDFYEMQELIHRQTLENGEVIILRQNVQPAGGRRYGFAVQLIESDRLGTPTDLANGRRDIRYGVELGPIGEPVAYWIRKTHPGDLWTARQYTATSDAFVRVPAYDADGRWNILHRYRLKRAGQTRGIPDFAPVLTRLKSLADYMEAEEVAARVTAAIALFIRKTDAWLAATGRFEDTDNNDKRIEYVEPGMIEYLNPGDEITPFLPQRPGNTFEPYVSAMLRWIAAALGLSYELVARDFSKTNYSSARAALLEAWRFFRNDQEWFSRRVFQPMWELVIEEAYLRGDLPIADFYPQRESIVQARWIAPGRGWVDPKNEIEADILAMQAGILTRADICAAQGLDSEEQAVQQAREQKQREDLGLDPMPALNTAPAAKASAKAPANGRGTQAEDNQGEQ